MLQWKPSKIIMVQQKLLIQSIISMFWMDSGHHLRYSDSTMKRTEQGIRLNIHINNLIGFETNLIIIFRQLTFNWSLHSPDFISLGFFIWGYIKYWDLCNTSRKKCDKFKQSFAQNIAEINWETCESLKTLNMSSSVSCEAKVSPGAQKITFQLIFIFFSLEALIIAANLKASIYDLILMILVI